MRPHGSAEGREGVNGSIGNKQKAESPESRRSSRALVGATLWSLCRTSAEPCGAPAALPKLLVKVWSRVGMIAVLKR